MIQDQNTQTNNPSNDIIEEVGEQELHNITGGCANKCGAVRNTANTYKQITEATGHHDLATQFKIIAKEAEVSRDGQWSCSFNTLSHELNDTVHELRQRGAV